MSSFRADKKRRVVYVAFTLSVAICAYWNVQAAQLDCTYCTHRVPVAGVPTVGRAIMLSGIRSATDCPDESPDVITLPSPAVNAADVNVTGSPPLTAWPDGTNIMFVDAHEVPVVWPSVTEMKPVVWEYKGLWHRYPVAATHEVPNMLFPLNTPRENSAPSTTAIINIAQP